MTAPALEDAGAEAATSPIVEAKPSSSSPLLFVSELTCGDQVVEVGVLNDVSVLRANGKDYPLEPVETASGGKYRWAGSPETSLWSKGDNGLLVLEGQTYPECTRTGGYSDDPFKETRAEGPWTARGNEPGWLLTLDGKEMTLVHAYGALTFRTPKPLPVKIEGGVAYADVTNTLVVTVLDKTCADDMTGMPHPNTVSVAFGEQTFNGCGGAPDDLLAGDAWTVSKINGAAVLGNAPITLTFDKANTRVGGNAGCNSYGGAYVLSGEGLSFGNIMSTLIGCEAPVANQERLYLDTLQSVSSFEVAESGGLVLLGPDGKRIEAGR